MYLCSDNHGTTCALFAYVPGEDLLGVDRAEGLARVRARSAGVRWQTAPVFDGFKNADDLYFDQLTQNLVDRRRQGRVALVGRPGE